MITREIAVRAFEAMQAAPHGRIIGCCRCYVQFVEKLKAADIKVLTAAGFKVTPRHRMANKVVYCGYDNMDGMAVGRAAAAAQAFKAAGIGCYDDQDGD